MARPAAHVARRPWEPLRVVGATTSEEAEAASANPQGHSRGAPGALAHGGIPRLSPCVRKSWVDIIASSICLSESARS